MGKLNIKQQSMVLLVAFLLMVGLFYFFAWTPQLTLLDDIAQQSKAEEDKIQAAKAKLAMLSEVKKNAANAEVELIKIQNQMPSDSQLPSLVVEFQNMANDAGVNLVSIKPGNPKAMGEFSTIDTNLAVVGSYVSLIDYLRRIEKSPRAMTVSTIDIAVAEYPNLTLNLTTSAFTMGAAGVPVAPVANTGSSAQPAPAAQPSNTAPPANTGASQGPAGGGSNNNASVLQPSDSDGTQLSEVGQVADDDNSVMESGFLGSMN
jgi:Tfp pilus assembly protein PilO